MFKPLESASRAIISVAFAAVALAVVATPSLARAAEITVYKSPTCGCCNGWIEHMQARGHKVVGKNTDDLDRLKKMAGIAEPLQSCHTALVDGYIVEGHVPGEDVERLLSERPEAKGLSAPGMPSGSPGMEGGAPEPYDVVLIHGNGTTSVFASH